MKNHVSTAISFAVAALSIAPAMAQQRVSFSFDGRPERLFRPVKGLNVNDSKSVRDAAIANLMEIHAAELALQHGRSAWTRGFAKDMLREHKAAHEELRLIAMRKGVRLPSALPTAERRMITRLSHLHGASFDRAYRASQLMGHRATSSKFKKSIMNGHDEDVKAYFVKTLPSVQYHYRLANSGHTITGPLKLRVNG